MEKENINNEIDLNNRSKTYREIYTFINDYTKEFTLESGSLPFKDKSEALNAEVILNRYYNNVKRKGLDYNRAEIDGVDYVVEFDSPKEISEDFANGDELKYMPNKAPTAGPLDGGVSGGMGEDLNEEQELDERLYLDKKRKALANAGFNVDGLCAEEILNLYQDLLGIEPYDEDKIRKEYNLSEALEELRLQESNYQFLDKGTTYCDRCGSTLNCRDAYIIDNPEFEDSLLYVCDKCKKEDDKVLRDPIHKEDNEDMFKLNSDSLTESKHDDLNPDIWDEDHNMKPEVKEKLIEVVNRFSDNLKSDGIELSIKDIVVIGSNANYNYTDSSDIDLHIVADTSVYENKEDLAMKCYQAYKTLFNNKYDPLIKGHEVEVYVEPDSIKANSNGMYSLYNGWIKEPVQTDIPDVDENKINELLKPYIDRFDSCETIEDIDRLIDDLYILRQQSILSDGEYGMGNLVFKEFRNKGYLSKLKDKKVELETKEMSLENLNEGLDSIEYRGYTIEHDIYGNDEWTVQVAGDDLWFNSPEEAMRAIDELDDDYFDIHEALKAIDEKLVYSIKRPEIVDGEMVPWEVDRVDNKELACQRVQELGPEYCWVEVDESLDEEFKFSYDDMKDAEAHANDVHGSLKSFSYDTGKSLVRFEDGSYRYYDKDYNEIELPKEMARNLLKSLDEFMINPYAPSKALALAEKQHAWLMDYIFGDGELKEYYRDGNKLINNSDKEVAEILDDGTIQSDIKFSDKEKKEIRKSVPEAEFLDEELSEEEKEIIYKLYDEYAGSIPRFGDREEAASEVAWEIMQKYGSNIANKVVNMVLHNGRLDESAKELVIEPIDMNARGKHYCCKISEPDGTNNYYESEEDAEADLARLNNYYNKLGEAVNLGDLDSPEEKDRQKRVFKQFAQKEADKKYQAEYERHPSKWDIRADKVNEDLAEDKAHALANHLGYEKDSMVDSDDNQIFTTYDDSDYLVLTEDEAHDRAVDEIKMIWDDLGMESFTPNFQKWILDNAVDKEWFDQWIEENNKEAEENNEPEDILSSDDSIQMFRDIFGDEEFSKVIEEKGLVDLDKVAEEAISLDGIAHFISYYDGKEIDLGNGLYAYRLN